MEEDFIFYSSGGFDFLERYLCQLYGEQRGSYVNNIQRYFSSKEFHDQCSVVYSLEDLPEVTELQIRTYLDREDWLLRRAKSIVEFYDEHISDDSISNEDYLAIAGELGLSGGMCEWYDTLFPHVANLFYTPEEQEKIIKKTRDEIGLIRTMVGTMIDGMRDGQLLEIDGEKRWSQGYARHYFRGENAYFKSSRASLLRDLDANAVQDPNSPQYSESVEEAIRVNLLRQTEFALWTHQLSFVKKWQFHIFDGAIGQHYGLKTSYLDVTSDLRVALFFACCKYENGQWRPLRDEEFAESGSRKNIADLGGDSRYGVLYCAPADILSMNAAVETPFPYITKVIPIGYQPFMRGTNQKGYVIEANLQYDMFQDWNFDKVKFRLTRQLCDWIFNEMKGGELIYGNDPVADITDIVEEIKTTRCFSRKTIDTHIALNPHIKVEELEKYLHQRGYNICDETHICSPNRQKEIETYWDENFTKYFQGKKIIRRPMFEIG